MKQIKSLPQETSKSQNSKICHSAWDSPETGVYYSKYPSVKLPTNPFLDVVSFIFSQKHDGFRALIDSSSGFAVSYARLSFLLKSMASGLQSLGVRKGDVILILLPNSVFFPIIFLGALCLGAIVAPMNPLSSLSEIKRQVFDSNASLAFCVREKVDELVTSLERIHVIGVPEFVGFDHVPTPNDCVVFHDLISSDPSSAPRPQIKQQDTAAILYSSGTTVIVTKKFNADEMVRDIEKHGVTHLHVVPTLLMSLTKKAKNASRNGFRSLKQVSCGAAPVSRKSIQEFIGALRHVDFIQGYGMTESTAIGTRGHNTSKAHKHSSVGLLSPNVQAKVVDWVTGSCLPPGCVGELWLQTPGNMKGYLNNLEATMDAIDKDGWLHTGDIVYFDQEGYLYIIDRLKDVIKYKGYQVAPAELEAVLMSHSEVLDAAVTAVNDEEAGEIPVAFVVPKDGSSVSEAALIDCVATQVAPYKKVRKVYFRSSIPRSAAGKILRRELRNLFTSKL